jgi:hypothetical protein
VSDDTSKTSKKDNDWKPNPEVTMSVQEIDQNPTQNSTSNETETQTDEWNSNPKVTMPVKRQIGKDWSSNEKVIMYVEETEHQPQETNDDSKY